MNSYYWYDQDLDIVTEFMAGYHKCFWLICRLFLIGNVHVTFCLFFNLPPPPPPVEAPKPFGWRFPQWIPFTASFFTVGKSLISLCWMDVVGWDDCCWLSDKFSNEGKLTNVAPSPKPAFPSALVFILFGAMVHLPLFVILENYGDIPQSHLDETLCSSSMSSSESCPESFSTTAKVKGMRWMLLFLVANQQLYNLLCLSADRQP